MWLRTLSENGAAFSVAFSSDGRRLAVAGGEGVQIWDSSRWSLLVTLMILPPTGTGRASREWIAFTPNGYYAGSTRVNRFIRWRLGDRLFPAEAYERQFHRPGAVQMALRGTE